MCEVITTSTGFCPIALGMDEFKLTTKKMMDLIVSKGNSSNQIPDVSLQSHQLNSLQALLSCTTSQDRNLCESLL